MRRVAASRVRPRQPPAAAPRQPAAAWCRRAQSAPAAADQNASASAETSRRARQSVRVGRGALALERARLRLDSGCMGPHTAWLALAIRRMGAPRQQLAVFAGPLGALARLAARAGFDVRRRFDQRDRSRPSMQGRSRFTLGVHGSFPYFRSYRYPRRSNRRHRICEPRAAGAALRVSTTDTGKVSCMACNGYALRGCTHSSTTRVKVTTWCRTRSLALQPAFAHCRSRDVVAPPGNTDVCHVTSISDP